MNVPLPVLIQYITMRHPVVLLSMENASPWTQVLYKDAADRMEQMREQASVQQPYKKGLTSDWRQEVNISEMYENIAQKFGFLENLEQMWNVHLLQRSTEKHIELDNNFFSCTQSTASKKAYIAIFCCQENCRHALLIFHRTGDSWVHQCYRARTQKGQLAEILRELDKIEFLDRRRLIRGARDRCVYRFSRWGEDFFDIGCQFRLLADTEWGERQGDASLHKSPYALPVFPDAIWFTECTANIPTRNGRHPTSYQMEDGIGFPWWHCTEFQNHRGRNDASWSIIHAAR